MAENIFDNINELRLHNENIYQQLGDIQNALSQMATVFQTKIDPIQENDNRKYYKLSARVKFSTYYNYVVVNDFSDLQKEIDGFSTDLKIPQSQVSFTEVSVGDCLQEFVEQYEKQVQNWYFQSKWDVSQGKNDVMTSLFDEIKQSPLYHTYSAFRKWEQFGIYREKLLVLCDKKDVSTKAYINYLRRLEKSEDVCAEYESIRRELVADIPTANFAGIRIPKREKEKELRKSYSYDIDEENLKFIFWDVEYNSEKGLRGIPDSIGYILTDTKLTVIDEFEFYSKDFYVEDFKNRLAPEISNSYVIVFGWSADFMCLPYFFEFDSYVKCDIGDLFRRALGSNRHIPLDKITSVVSQENETNGTSIADAQQILKEFKLLCNLRGDSPCDIVRFFQMELRK